MTAPTELSPQTLRPEDELLLHCARAELDPPTTDRIGALAAATIDWSYLCWSAEMHALLPMLYWHVNACCPEAAPSFIKASLQIYYQENARRSDEADAWVVRTLRLLSDAGIQAVPIQGPSVASALYSHVALRQLTDVRLVVRERDFTRAKKLLCIQGCSPSFASQGGVTARERIFAKINRGYVLGTNDIATPVELRYEITPTYFRVPFDIERLFPHAPAPLDRAAVMAPSPENLLLILCLDGAQHLWKELAILCDVAELVRRHDHLDWNAVLQTARSDGCLSVLFLGLLLAEHRLDIRLPSDIAREMQADHAVTAIAAAISARPFTSARRPPGLMERLRFHLPLRKRFREKIELAIGLATPGPADVPALPTPRALDFVYYLVRPVRYCADQVRQLKRARPTRPQWSGTPAEVVDRMLKLANVKPGDLVYDLGCGEGRIVIHAAKHYGARAVGVDVDKNRVRESRDSAQREGVNELVRFERMDGFDVNLRSATVVALSMTTQWNDGIALKLRDELPPAARVVSWNTDMAGWHPQRVDIVRVGREICRIYLWEIDRHR